MAPYSTNRQPPDRSHTVPVDPDAVRSAALRLEHMTGAAYLLTEFQDMPSAGLPLQGFEVYLSNIAEAAGQSQDPIYRILVEQLLMAHHKVGRLNRASAMATSPEVAAAYDRSAVALTAEIRRLALALKAYREPTPSQHVTVVKQQNLAHNQQVAFVERPPESELNPAAAVPMQTSHDTELTSKGEIDYVFTGPPLQKPSTRGRRPAQPVVASGTQRSRSAEVKVNGPQTPAVAVCNGSSYRLR